MRRGSNPRNQIGKVAIILAAVMIATSISNIARNSADPNTADNLNGTKTATWNFQNPSNYTVENVTIGGAEAKLKILEGSLFEGDAQNFSKGSTDANSTITPDGNVTLLGNETNLIMNGDFSSAANWNYTNSSDGNVTVDWTGTSARFSHNSPNVELFDTMDRAASDLRWLPGGSAPPSLNDEVGNRMEGESSLNLTWDPEGDATKMATIQRDDAGTWDWHACNRIRFWAVATAGAMFINVTLFLYNQTASWRSSKWFLMDSIWNGNEYGIYFDSAFGGDLSEVDRVELGFSGVGMQTTLLIDNVTVIRQLDDMDKWGSSRWWGESASIYYCYDPVLLVEAADFVEGTSSLYAGWRAMSPIPEWAMIYRDEPGTWNMSHFDDVMIWLKTNMPSGLNVTIFLYNLTDNWSSPKQKISTAWKPYVFDMSSAFGSDLSEIDRIGLIMGDTNGWLITRTDNISGIKQFDSMDTLSTWMQFGSVPMPPATINTGYKVEGGGSLNITWDPGGNRSIWARIGKTSSWDWSPYNRLSLWVAPSAGANWLNMTIRLYNPTSSWTSPLVGIIDGWNKYSFDIGNVFNGDLSRINKFEINFTGVSSQTSVYIDDINLTGLLDGMDDAFGYAMGIIFWKPGGPAPPSQAKELFTKTEGEASLRLWWNPLSNSSNWADLLRSFTGNLSEYNKVRLMANTAYTGANLNLSLSFFNSTASRWDTSPVTLKNGWNEYVFDLRGMPTGISYNVMRVSLNFTGASSVATVYIDDIRLAQHKIFNQTAYVNQTFTKYGSTPASPDQVVLTFDHIALNNSGALKASIEVQVEGAHVGTVDIPGVAPWSKAYFDLSTFMTLPGQYNISIGLNLVVDSPYELGFVSHIDNVSIIAPNYTNGVFVSQEFNASGVAIWKNMSWSESILPGTDITVQIRFGNSSAELQSAQWSPPFTNSNFESIEFFNSYMIQYRVNLNTTNASATPVFSDITIAYQKYFESGYVETEDLSPPDIIAWGMFNAADTRPIGTSVAYWYSTNAGGNWIGLAPGEDLSAASIQKIRFRAVLATTDASRTPVLSELNITYRYLGSLAYFTIIPSNPGAMNVSDTRTFGAFGYDSFGNFIGPVAVFWNVNGGMGTIPLGPSTTAVFTALNEGSGQLIASDSYGHTNSTSSFSVFNSPPVIIGQVPDQTAREDSSSWNLDLNSNASDDSPKSDLKWFLSGNDDTLYYVSGESVAGNHILTFTPLKDAWGDDLVTLWLEDPSGLKVGQDIWINITPVNDPPTFSVPPDLCVKVDKDYAFDYSPYINDVDNDHSELILTVDDEYATANGLVVTYRYPTTSGNEERTVRLSVSDGDSKANATITVNAVSPGIFGGWGWDSIMLMNFGWLGLLGLAIALFLLIPIIRNRRKKFTVEDIFLTHRDGRLIAHYTRELRPDRDEDILAGMLTAVQEFIKDSMGRQEVLKRFEFQMQDKKVLVESGDNIYIAVFTSGEVPQDASDQLRIFLEDVEQAYANIIPDWSGDTNAFKGLKDLMDVLLVGRGYKKGYWKKLKFLSTNSVDKQVPPESTEDEKKTDQVVNKEIDKFLEELEDLQEKVE